jgi:prophage antirepressor-like protein
MADSPTLGALAPEVFAFDSHAVRAVMIDSEPWFVGKDVAEALGYSNPSDAMNDHCKGVAKRYPIVDRLGRTQEARVLNLSDTLRLIVGSNLPAAESFERWVFEQVLPSILKTGAYFSAKGARPNQPPVGRFTGMTASHLIALQDQSYKLMNRLKRETLAEVRAALYAQLQAVFADLGQSAPPLATLGHEAPPLLAEFWRAYEQLGQMGVPLNHARRPGLIAINLKQMARAAAERGVRLPTDQIALKTALRDSRSPRFFDVRTVASSLLGHSVYCWVFEQQGGWHD